jgi:hypothetical protein
LAAAAGSSFDTEEAHMRWTASMVTLAAVMALGPGAWAQAPAMSDKDKMMEKDKTMDKSGAMPDKMEKGKMDKGQMEKGRMMEKDKMMDKGMATDKDKMEKKP